MYPELNWRYSPIDERHPLRPTGPAASFDFDAAVGYMARLTGLPAARVALPTTPYRYDTSIDKARRELRYEPRYTITDMIDQAASWWRRARGRREQAGPS